MNPIDEVVNELKQAGLLDSHVEFSIDFGKALEKLGGHLLPDARMYVLRLYQSAVCGGASQVDFAGRMGRLQCRIAGPPVPLEQLQQLAHYLTPGARPLSAHYLAATLQAALSSRPRKLQLVTWDGQEGASLTFSQGRESFQSWTFWPTRPAC